VLASYRALQTEPGAGVCILSVYRLFADSFGSISPDEEFFRRLSQVRRGAIEEEE